MKFQSKPQSAMTKQQFFNASFYQEKLDQTKTQVNQSGSYVSFQFVKRYFQATKINQLINKSVQTTLQSSYLPQNPYNMIGRFLLHHSIYQNIKAYYSTLQADRSRKHIQDNSTSAPDQKNAMKDFKIGNKYYSVGWRLANLIRLDRVDALWPLLLSQKSQNVEKKKSKKTKMINISYSLGGSLLLKVGSPYSAKQTLSITLFYTISISETNDQAKRFAEFIIDDCIHICQSPNNVFIKLSVCTNDPVSTEWSAQNLIHNRIKVIKQIEKVCYGSSDELKVDYLMKVPRETVKIVGTSYLRISKTYVLIEQDNANTKIHSKCPVKILLTSVFSQQSVYLQSVMRAFQINGTPEELTHQMNSQLHKQIINSLEQQQPAWIGWCLFFSNLYNETDKNKQKQLKTSIYFMMDSPLGFIDMLRHEINVTKILSGRSSSATYESQIVQLLQKCQKRVKMHIQKQQHIYPQTLLFFQAVNRNLQLILQQQQVKKKQSIKPILSRIQLLFKYLLNSFHQICFVLRSHILNQIVNIDNQFGKDGSGEIISNTVTYDIFLRKYKDLPERTLKIVDEVARYRSAFNRPDSDIKQLILAKYVERYGLYQKVYEFYWKVICGKKLSYPMGQFVTMLRNQAIRFQSKTYQKKSIKFNIEEKKTDGIMIYQRAADSRGQHPFYSLSAEALDDENIRIYRTIKQLFEQYFKNNLISEKSTKSLSNLQKNTYILSISSDIGRMISEQSDFNSCKLYVDSIYHVPINPADIYRFMYDQIVENLDILTKNSFGVLGIYNGDKELMDEDEVYPWTENQQKYDVNFLRYTPKKPLNVQSVAKLLKMCKANQTQIIVRGVFWMNGLLKNCEISFNFLINKEWHINHAHIYQKRVFSRHEDIARWGNYNGLKQYIASRKKIEENPKMNKKESLKQKYLSNHIDLIQFVAEDMETPLEINKVRTYSPFYSQLEQSLSLVKGLFYLLEYFKTDKNTVFQIKDLKDTVDMLEYYLFDKCLRMDKFIYSEGLSVSIINIVSRIHKYISEHSDNNGQEKQLIFLQKVMIKLMNCIHYVLTSCAFGVIQAINNQYIKEDDSDDD